MEQLSLAGITPRPQHNIPTGGIGEFGMKAAGDRYLLPGIWSLLIEPRPEMIPADEYRQPIASMSLRQKTSFLASSIKLD